ncbi:tetratricopeptide repeat protein [Paractinoplanes toevensis]|uniref:tetratricopeptide repeat protein n=1 Tax=Paractinoplanes toevensis TaxID=571911 RepID=UPI001BB37093|nr:hypothetical protein [Actinoplanes toevensis]
MALSQLAGVSAGLGDRGRAQRLADDAHRLVAAIADQQSRTRSQLEVAEALARAGAGDRARALADEAEQWARQIPGRSGPAGLTDNRFRATALWRAAEVCTDAGDYARAERFARALSYFADRAEALSRVALALVRSGAVEEARRLAAEAEQLARATAESYPASRVLRGLAIALAASGDTTGPSTSPTRAPDRWSERRSWAISGWLSRTPVRGTAPNVWPAPSPIPTTKAGCCCRSPWFWPGPAITTGRSGWPKASVTGRSTCRY